jgi:hypothetical protein
MYCCKHVCWVASNLGTKGDIPSMRLTFPSQTLYVNYLSAYLTVINYAISLSLATLPSDIMWAKSEYNVTPYCNIMKTPLDEHVKKVKTKSSKCHNSERVVKQHNCLLTVSAPNYLQQPLTIWA